MKCTNVLLELVEMPAHPLMRMRMWVRLNYPIHDGSMLVGRLQTLQG